MSMYPSLEDMKVDHMAQAQSRVGIGFTESPAEVHHTSPSAPPPYYTLHPTAPGGELSHLYPELQEYMGLELTPEVIAANMPEYAVAVRPETQVGITSAGMVAPLSSQSMGLQRAQTTHGIRPMVLCKGKDGKVGLRVKALSKGVFVVLVEKDSPAALAGLRFGDQILQINGETVAGYSMDKVHSMFKKAEQNGIQLAVRDRPFERTVTLHKDSAGQVGFQFKEGKISAIVKDSSAARNGLLIDHHLLEVNGQNVVGLKDKDVRVIIDKEGTDIVTVTIMPSFVYEHMVKTMATSLLKKHMDHSIPDL